MKKYFKLFSFIVVALIILFSAGIVKADIISTNLFKKSDSTSVVPINSYAIGTTTNPVNIVANNLTVTGSSTGVTVSGGLLAANNLSDVANAATAADNIGLGTSDNASFGSVTTNGATVNNVLNVSELCFTGDGCQTSINPIGNAVTLYYVNATSDIATYEQLSLTPSTGAEIAETATSSNGLLAPIDSYVSTTTDLVFSSIPAGSWAFHTYANVSSDVGVSRMVGKIYLRNASGTETLIATATSSEMTTGIKEYQFNGIGIATTTVATDRIVAKVYFYTDSVVTTTGTFYYQGVSNYSHIVTPFAIAVENFVSKQTNYKPIQFIIEYPSASEKDGIFIFNASSTIRKVTAVNKTAGDTVTFNLGYSNSMATATSSLNKLFSSNQVVTSTTTPTVFTINASSTPSTGNVLQFFTTAASSTQFILTAYYTED